MNTGTKSCSRSIQNIKYTLISIIILIIYPINQKTVITVLVVIIITLAATTSYFVGRLTSTEESPELQTTTTQQENPETDGFKNWKVYTNETIGYELKVPNNWKVDSTPDGTSIYVGPESLVMDSLFGINTVLQTPKVGISNNQEVLQIENTLFAGHKAKRVYTKNISVGEVATQLYMEKDGRILAIIG